MHCAVHTLHKRQQHLKGTTSVRVAKGNAKTKDTGSQDADVT